MIIRKKWDIKELGDSILLEILKIEKIWKYVWAIKKKMHKLEGGGTR